MGARRAVLPHCGGGAHWTLMTGAGGGGARLGSFESAGVLGELKAKPLARSLEDSRALISPARAGARGGSSEGEDEEVHVMSLKIYTVVLELVRRVAPLIKVLRARSSAGAAD
jgi:hypothetical protein